MKYRMLTKEELVHLEDELKQFLIINGVEGETWQKLNENNPEKAIQLVGLFSDMVLQRVYEKLTFLEFRSTESCMLFRVLEDHIELISITPKSGSMVDLSTIESIHTALKEESDQLNYFTSSKTFTSTREEEIHLLVQQGCEVSSKEFWDAIVQVLG